MRDRVAKKLMRRDKYDIWLSELPVGKCNFCEWEKYQIVIKNYDRWVWVACIAPYWKYHTMLLPKRHAVRFGDLNNIELAELKRLEKAIIDRYRSAELVDSDNRIIEQVVSFWRTRDISNTTTKQTKLEHFHLHFTPDRDGAWNPILDQEAYLTDLEKLL